MGTADEASLLAAIRAAPADDAPRLVYADMLLQRGDVRGELIVLGCEIAKREAAHDVGDAYMALTQRLWELLKENKRSWEDALGIGKAIWCTWRRGFIDTMSGDADDLAAIVPVLEALPLEHLLVSSRSKPDFARVHASGALGAAPDLVIHSFAARGTGMDEDSVRLLASAETTARPTSLRLNLSPFAGELDALARAPFFSRLHALDIGLGIDDAMIAAVRGQWRSSLRELTLDTPRLTREGYAALTSDPSLSALSAFRLRTLDGSPGEGDDVITAIAASPCLESLTTLAVVDVGPRGLAALAHATKLAGLRSLSLSDARLGASSMKALLAAMPALEELTLTNGNVDSPALDVLAERGPTSLRRFALHGDHLLAGAGATRLVTSSRLSLRDLELIGDFVSDDVVATLSTATPMAKLTSLRLMGRFRAAGSAALVASPVLARGLSIIMSAYNPAQDELCRRFPRLEVR